MRRKIIFITWIITLFALQGCGNQRVKSDDEILQELNTDTIQYESQELMIQEIEITDRRTDIDNKKDTVYIYILADNDVVSCEMSYVAKYSLYDQGWILEDFLENDRDSWIIRPVSGPENELLEEYLHYSQDGYVDSDVRLNEGTALYYYEEDRDEEYCSTRYLYEARYEFDTGEKEWKYIDSETIEIETEWDVDGVWSYVDPSSEGFMVTGGTALDCENHHAMMNIEVNGDVAHVVAYTRGDNIVYFDGDIVLEPGKGGCSDPVEFSYESPGFMPIVFSGEIYIEPDRVFINWGGHFERISTDINYTVRNEPTVMHYYEEMYYERTYVLDYTLRFEQDMQGRITTVRQYDANDNLVNSVNQEYDSDGNCTKVYSLGTNIDGLYLDYDFQYWENGMLVKNEDSDGRYVMELENNNAGKPVKRYFYSVYSDGENYMIDEIAYDTSGRAVQGLRSNFAGGWTADFNCYYNGADDKPSCIEVKYSNGDYLRFDYEYEYDDLKRLVCEKEYRTDEEGKLSAIVTKTYEY